MSRRRPHSLRQTLCIRAVEWVRAGRSHHIILHTRISTGTFTSI